MPSPILPPGTWDFYNSSTMQTALLANYNTFSAQIGTFILLEDGDSQPYGWLLESSVLGVIDIGVAAEIYGGSSGMEIVDTGPDGGIQSSANFTLASGPDIFRFSTARATDPRTGSTLTGSLNDNDLVIGGSEEVRPVGDEDVRSATIHTGPGSDLFFIRNMEHAAVDMGNGANGRTDTLDTGDGNDIAVIEGNFIDSRIYGGYGDDLFVWYIDEINTTNLLYANSFFGAGGWDPAVWQDEGTDRLILVVPDATSVFSGPGTPDPGEVQLGSRPGFPDFPVPDPPTVDNIYARYYSTAGLSPEGRRTVFIDYRPVTGSNHAGDNYLTGVEEIQIGIGPNAKVYRIDDINGEAVLASDLVPRRDIPSRAAYHQLVDDFVAGVVPAP